MRFAFLGGLPRSGSTLIAALLNQRPDVHVSTTSDAALILYYVHITLSNEENYAAGSKEQRDNLFHNLLPTLYADRSESLVIDKGRLWGTPYYRKVITESLGYEPRIIAPVRPLTEIMASFIRMCDQYPDNFIDRVMRQDDFHSYWRKPLSDARTDWMLLPNGHLGSAMLALHGAMKPETAGQYHLVSYAELCDNTREVLAGIERFIDLEPFDYKLEGITGQVHNDAEVYGMPTMHHVRERIERIDPDPATILSAYAMARCELEDYWS